MNYVVFDLEWNQPFDETAVVVDPVYLSGEIVQIGAVKLNENFETVDELRLYVKPVFYAKMHRKIASLTGVHDRELQEKGISFPEACKKFLTWCGDDFAFMTWSQSDMPVLIENMQVHGIDVSNLPDLIDAQRIFGNEIMRSDAQVSLERAMEILGEQGEAAHDALHDAQNTVKVCDHMDLEQCIGEYVTRIFVDNTVQKIFPGSKEMLDDEALHRLICPYCGGEMDCEPWIPYRHGQFLTMAACPEEDEFLVYLSWNQIRHQGLRPQRMVYEMSDDLWDLYCREKERSI